MLKGKGARLFLASSVAALALAILAWLGTFTDSYESCQSANRQRDAQKQIRKSNEWKFLQCEGNTVDSNNGTITAIGTALLAWITYMLVSLGRDQSKTTRAELRAYVFPRIAKLEKFSLTEPIVVTAAWKNAGHTPARLFETHGGIFVGSLPLEDDAHFEDKAPNEPELTGRHSKSALFPGVEVAIDYESPKALSDLGVQEAIVKGRVAIYVVGRAFYRDIFDIDRSSLFCAFIDPDDAARLIDATRKNLPLKDFVVRFSNAHVLNDFT